MGVKLLYFYTVLVGLVSAALALTTFVLAGGYYIPPAWQQVADPLAGSPRYVTLESPLPVGGDAPPDAELHLRVELVSRHDPTIRAIEHSMGDLRAVIAERLAEWSAQEIAASSGARLRLSEELLLATQAALEEREQPNLLEAVYLPRAVASSGFAGDVR